MRFKYFSKENNIRLKFSIKNKLFQLKNIYAFVYYLLLKKLFFIYKEYVDIWRICNGLQSVFMNLANKNILNYVLVILVVRNIFIKYLTFREFISSIGEFND